MTHPRLFWHLIRFHFLGTPWFMLPMMLAIIVVVSLLSGIDAFFGDGVSMGHYRSYDQIFPFVYIFILAAQITYGLQLGKNQAQNHAWTTGSNTFLFTRAIHRPTLYWAKLAVFFFICAIPVLPTVVQAILHPDIRIQLYQAQKKRAEKLAVYQAAYPNLRVESSQKNPKDQIVTLPGAGWSGLALKSAKVLSISLCVLWLALLARAMPKIWIAVFGFFLVAIFSPLVILATKSKPGWWFFVWDDEKMLFWSNQHQVAIWLTLALLTVLVLWDSRRRFLDISHGKGASV